MKYKQMLILSNQLSVLSRKYTVKLLINKLKTCKKAKNTLWDLKYHFNTHAWPVAYDTYLIDSGLEINELNLLIEKLGCDIIYSKASTKLMIVKV